MPLDERPWWERIPAIVMYPASVAGVLTVIFLGALGWLGSAVAAYGTLGLGSGVIVGLIFTTIFAIIRESADGRVAFPEIGNFSNVREDVVFPGMKAAALGVFLFLPLIVALISGQMSAYEDSHTKRANKQISAEQEASITEMLKAQGVVLPASTAKPVATAEPEIEMPAERHSARTGALVLATIVAAVLYPLCLLILAMSRSLQTALNPIVWGQILSAVGVPAWLGVLAGIAGLGLLGAILSFPFDLLSIALPIVPSIAASIVCMWFSFGAAHLLGWFVWTHRAQLGHSADVREEMTADRVRRIKEATIAEVSKGKGRAPAAPGGIVVGAGAGAMMPPAARVVPDAPADSLPPTQEEIGALSSRLSVAFATKDMQAALATTPSLLDALWQLGDIDAILRVWGSFSKADPDGSLDPQRQARIARLLEERKQPLEAAAAWRVLALKHPASAQSPKALFRCAELYTTTGHPDWAKSALEILVQRYPGTDEAQLARSRLRPRP